MHPYPRLRRYFSTGKHVTGFSGRFTPLQIQFLCHPGGGSLLSAFLSANLCHSFYSDAKTSPSGGGAVGRRGAFSTPVRAVCLFFSPARQGGCTVLYKLATLLRCKMHPLCRLKATSPPCIKKGRLLAVNLIYAHHGLCPLSGSEHNPWHRGPSGPMDAIRPSAPKAQAPSGIQESAAGAPGPEPEPDPGPDPFSYSLFLTC